MATRPAHLVIGGRFFYAVTVDGVGRLLTQQWADGFIATIDAP